MVSCAAWDSDEMTGDLPMHGLPWPIGVISSEDTQGEDARR
jgi:hypothetical protein